MTTSAGDHARNFFDKVMDGVRMSLLYLQAHKPR